MPPTAGTAPAIKALPEPPGLPAPLPEPAVEELRLETVLGALSDPLAADDHPQTPPGIGAVRPLLRLVRSRPAQVVAYAPLQGAAGGGRHPPAPVRPRTPQSRTRRRPQRPLPRPAGPGRCMDSGGMTRRRSTNDHLLLLEAAGPRHRAVEVVSRETVPGSQHNHPWDRAQQPGSSTPRTGIDEGLTRSRCAHPAAGSAALTDACVLLEVRCGRGGGRTRTARSTGRQDTGGRRSSTPPPLRPGTYPRRSSIAGRARHRSTPARPHRPPSRSRCQRSV